MGDPGAACLLRSFSHPSGASRQYEECDPIRCLTESISFGRYLSDSLAWEKWSTFSHNRYLEEVEKFSKPGSVAEKRAFFEAHYKKKAAAKVAASQLVEASAASGVVQELENTHKAQDNSSINLNSAQANNQVASYGEKAAAKVAASQFTEDNAAIGAVQESENSHIAWDNFSSDLDSAKASNQVAPYGEKAEVRAAAKVAASQFTEANAASGVVQESGNTHIAWDDPFVDLDSVKANDQVPSYGEKAEARAAASQSEDASRRIVRQSENTNLGQENSSIDLDLSEANNLVRCDEQHEGDMPGVCVENSEDTDELELNNSEDVLGAAVADIEEPSKEVSDGDISRGEVISHSHLENMKNHASLSMEMSVKEPVEEEISTSAEKKVPEASSSKLSIQKRLSKFPFSRAKERTSLPSKNGKCANPSSDKSAVNIADKKRLTRKSLHTSINLASTKGNANKTDSPVLPLIRKARECKLPSIIQKDFSDLPRSTSTLATNVDSKHASGIQKTCTKRSEALHSMSISGGLVAGKSSEIKSSNALGSKGQNPTVCSKFRFRSEERAAKRKEELEEKINAKVEEKINAKFKRKEEQNIRKSLYVFGIKTRENTESSRQVQSSNNLTKAALHTRSQSPRSGKKFSSRSDRETKSKPPRQPSVNVNTESFKDIKGKGKRMMTYSVMSLPPWSLHENASPNIQAHNERRKAG